MRGILQIFRKDVRRLALPILLLLAIEATAAFAEIYRYTSAYPDKPLDLAFTNLLLLHFTWIFLIAAVIQQEPLPGTNQYWLTRPIGWPKLLAAKLLFVGLFVNAMWLLSDFAILLVLHLPVHPLNSLVRQIPLTIILFLPALCLAAITSTLAQLACGIIVFFIALLLEVIAPSMLFPNRGANFSAYFVDGFTVGIASLYTLLPLLTLLTIVLQYRHRRTVAARWLFALPTCLIPVVLLATIGGGFLPKPEPPVNNSDPQFANVQISFDFADKKRPLIPPQQGRVEIHLPIQVRGLPPAAYTEWSALGMFVLDKNLFVTNVEKDIYGSSLLLSLTNQEAAALPHKPKDVTTDATLAIYQIKRRQQIQLSNTSLISLDAEIDCRSIPSRGGRALFCWTGPSRFRAVNPATEKQARFLELGLEQAMDSSLPWVFSPIQTVTPSAPANKQLEIWELAPLGKIKRTLHATNVDLTPYLP